MQEWCGCSWENVSNTAAAATAQATDATTTATTTTTTRHQEATLLQQYKVAGTSRHHLALAQAPEVDQTEAETNRQN
jgi:hypothetical protein